MALRAGELPAAEEGFCYCRCGVPAGSGKSSKVGGTHLRHRRLWREAEPGGTIDGGRGTWRAGGSLGPARNVLPGGELDPEEGEAGRGGKISAGISEEGAEAFWLSAIRDGARMAGSIVREPRREGIGGKRISSGAAAGSERQKRARSVEAGGEELKRTSKTGTRQTGASKTS